MLREKYVTTPEAAKLIGKGENLVAKLCQAGRLPGAEKMGNTWLIPRESVLSYTPGTRGPKPRKAKLAAEKAAILEQAKLAAEREEMLKRAAEFGGVVMELPEEVQEAMDRAEASERRRKQHDNDNSRENHH